MIWIVEPAAPWRITAADQEASQLARLRAAGTSGAPLTLLECLAPDDGAALEAALGAAAAGRKASCLCRDRDDIPGRLTLTSLTDAPHALDANRPVEIVALWTPREEDEAGVATTAGADQPAGRRGSRLPDTSSLQQFVGMIGHDLRTPLNGVVGMSRLLMDSGLRPDQVDYARAIDTSAEHLVSVIEDLVEFATLDVQTDLHPADFAPRALVEDVVESQMSRAAEKDIEICAIVSASVPEIVEADAARMRQVLGYLVGDGINWTRAGDVVVRVSSEEDPVSNGVPAAAPGPSPSSGLAEPHGEGVALRLRFEVTASEAPPAGGGSAPTRTTQPRDAISGASPRAAICHHLVRLLGGTVGTHAASGSRSWWFNARVRPRPRPPAVAPTYVSLAGRRVLCVDDHPVSQRVLLERLRCWNLTVEATHEAHGALTLMKVASAAGTPFELAILDLRLPGIDGLALARMIKSDPVLASTKLVLLTGYPARGQAVLAQEAGIDAYLQKPIREAPLLSCLETLLGGRPPSLRLMSGRRFDEERERLRPRVLVAEDNPVSQKVAVQMLEKLGCRVDVVADGTEAVQAITHTPYHLVLMDCQLSGADGIDGLDATRQVRSLASHSVSPPIIALTADTTDRERDACLAAGMNDFMMKPLRLVTLREKLAQWIDASPQR